MRHQKKVLLTGGNGFIGRNIKESLQNDYFLLTPRSYELNLCDSFAVREYFENENIDFVIHCATVGGSRGVQDSPLTVEENLLMVENLLSSKRDDVRVMLFGSGAMYDKSRPLEKIKESQLGESIPKDLYGQSKMLIAEKIKMRKDVLCLNIFACYGHGEKESRFPTYAINQVLKGEDICINQDVIFDYLFVEDMQKIVNYFIENEPVNNIINLTPTQSISLCEISQIVNGFVENPVKINITNPVMNNEYKGSK